MVVTPEEQKPKSGKQCEGISEKGVEKGVEKGGERKGRRGDVVVNWVSRDGWRAGG